LVLKKRKTHLTHTGLLMEGTGQREIPVYSQRMNPTLGSSEKGTPRGLTAIGIFLLFGTVMAFLAGTTLVWRGTFLDRMRVLRRSGAAGGKSAGA
jgi:hypothetical protein